MKTTANGIQIPDTGSSASTDSFGDIVGAVIANANASDAIASASNSMLTTTTKLNESSIVHDAQSVTKKYGYNTLVESHVTPTLNPFETRTIDITMPSPFKVYDDDHICVRLKTPNYVQSVRLLSYSRLNSTTVRTVVQNTNENTFGITVTATILQVGISYYG